MHVWTLFDNFRWCHEIVMAAQMVASAIMAASKIKVTISIVAIWDVLVGESFGRRTLCS